MLLQDPQSIHYPSVDKPPAKELLHWKTKPETFSWKRLEHGSNPEDPAPRGWNVLWGSKIASFYRRARTGNGRKKAASVYTIASEYSMGKLDGGICDIQGVQTASSWMNRIAQTRWRARVRGIFHSARPSSALCPRDFCTRITFFDRVVVVSFIIFI